MFCYTVLKSVNNKWSNRIIYVSVIGTRSLSMSDYLVGLENSGWLRHIKAVVDAAVFLTKVISYALIFVSSINIFIKWSGTFSRCQRHHWVSIQDCTDKSGFSFLLQTPPYNSFHGDARLWQGKEPVCWSIVQMGGTGQLRSALWGLCSWTPTTALSRASW